MAYFAGLDVSVKETSVCIVDDAGKIVREARVASEPEALLQMLTNNRLARVGLEAGPLSQWLYSVLAEAGLPVICVETRNPAVQTGLLPQRCVLCFRRRRRQIVNRREDAAWRKHFPENAC
jgi:transposase